MPKRSSRPKHPDLNQLTASIVGEATDDEPRAEPQSDKNPHAAALGRLGGLKGGKARAAKMTPERRREIAKRAAQARWQREADH